MDPPKITRKSNAKKKMVQISSFEKASESSQCYLAWNIKDVISLLEEYLKTSEIAAMFEIQDILTITRVCKSFHRVFNKQYQQLVIRLGNLEANKRYLFWIYQAPYIKYL